MNKEELRKKYQETYNSPSYSYVKEEDKELELKFHDLLVDIMTDEKSANRLIFMFNDDRLPQHYVDEHNEHDMEQLFDFESMIVHNDILDDGEFWVIYDPENDKWLFDKTYDLLDYAPEVCRDRGLDFSKVKIIGVDSWRRNEWKTEHGEKMTTLWLEDVITVFECVKSGDFTSLKNEVPVKSLSKRYEYYNRT